MAEYDWQWEQGDGPHYWLRDLSGRFRSEHDYRTSSAGYIDPSEEGWEVHAWNPRDRVLATLPGTLEQSELRDTAKMLILLSLKGDNDGA